MGKATKITLVTMTLAKRYYKNDVELAYSCLQIPNWFCRFWINHDYYESRGKTKFEAYRKARAKRKQTFSKC